MTVDDRSVSGARDDAELAASIASSRPGAVVQTKLTTDERVLARVTDGIYREPASALRELVSNSYDADATEVVIQTDRPRFSSITVRDNGNGMSPASLSRLVRHIGGSAKRSSAGADLNVTDTDDPLRSPKGRRLIGRIGIGLFSVSQLAHSFQIITKTAGDSWRTVADIRMRALDEVGASNDPKVRGEAYETGRVTFWRIPADDLDTHGTTVVLTDLRRQAKSTLSSQAHWERVRNGISLPFRYHVGRLNNGEYVGDDDDLQSLPWEDAQAPSDRFYSFVRNMWSEVHGGSVRNPSLEHLCDEYLRMVWSLALSAPLPYVDVNPFNVSSDSAALYVFDGAGPDAVKEAEGGSLAASLDEGDGPTDGVAGDFAVYVDDLQLARPLLYTGLPVTNHALTRPMIFAGSCRDDFPNVDPADSGGVLKFSGYLMWAPKIVPQEHNGLLIRVHGSSGTLFDRSFLGYQVAERTRLAQLTGEIFIDEGFEAALNIDREGINVSHPHAERLTSWVHLAITRAINRQKVVANGVRRANREAGSAESLDALQRRVQVAWQREQRDKTSPPPVVWDEQPNAFANAVRLKSANFSSLVSKTRANKSLRQEQLAAVVQLLAAYNLTSALGDEALSALVEELSVVMWEEAK